MKRIKRFIKIVLLFYLFIALIYWSIIRPKHINWGSTPEEINLEFPGDELISSARIITTRAINVHATKKEIWPWIAQTGQNRGGFNSYDWLENLFGAGMKNADRINPLWQHPKPGDTVYYGKNMPYGLLSLVKPHEYYSIQGWTFYLQSIDSTNTRLIIRYPSVEVKNNLFASIYYYSQFESLHFIMESGMMMGIKQKAEKKDK